MVMKMSKKVIAVANQKGGVGKTTTCVNLAASLTATNRRVLLIDLDPQGNATTGSGINKLDVKHSAYDVLMQQVDAKDAILSTNNEGFFILPSNSDLTAAEVELLKLDQREQRLKNALQGIADGYDYVLIDCPPALNILTLNALVAADSVIIPMQCEYFAMEGLSALVQTIEDVKASVNSKLRIEGLLRTMFDGRNNLGSDVSTQLTEHFGEQVYRTVIPRNVRLAEAPSFGQPVLSYDRTSQGALAYLALAGEIIRKEARHNEAYA